MGSPPVLVVLAFPERRDIKSGSVKVLVWGRRLFLFVLFYWSYFCFEDRVLYILGPKLAKHDPELLTFLLVLPKCKDGKPEFLKFVCMNFKL